MFLDANAVAEGQRVATLLTVIWETVYKIVRNLVAPASPKQKTYTELKDALSAHFSPKPLFIAERYRFHKREQLPRESIATYVAELSRFARHCNFGTNLYCLRDWLVCGLSNTHIIKKIACGEGPRSIQSHSAGYSVGDSLSSCDGALERRPSLPRYTSSHLLQTDDRRRSRSHAHRHGLPASPALTEECFRCARTGHHPQDCLCSDMECHACGKKRHISRPCPWKRSDGAKKMRATHAVEETSEDDDVFALHYCQNAQD